MKKIIILLLCCAMLVSMVGCGGNTAPPPTKSPPTTVSKTVIKETPTETIPPVTAVEPTEKEKELPMTVRADQATKPTTTDTEPTTTAKLKEKVKPTETPKPTEPSAAENTEPKDKKTPKAEKPQKEEEIYVGIQWPEVDPADIERLVIEKINAYRIAQGDTAATILPGLTEVARYRATELTTSFEHRGEQRVSTELKYGQYVDLAPYGMSDDSYYKGYSREAIGMGDWFGTAESMSDRIADGFHHSKGHWSYVGSSKYPYIAVGIAKATGKWYVCVLMSDDNYGG
jgi:uncharacterized protein YkwD